MTCCATEALCQKAGKFKNVPFVLTDGPVKVTKVEPIDSVALQKKNETIARAEFSKNSVGLSLGFCHIIKDNHKKN